MFRRFLPFILVGALSTLFLLSVFSGRQLSWRNIPQLIGFGEGYGPTEEQIASGENILPDLRQGKSEQPDEEEWRTFKEPKIENMSPYPQGKTKPAGSNYTKTLVIPRLKSEPVGWIEEELGDLIEARLLKTAVYTVDDRKAKLHPPKNKGHEVMVYLSYIIDNYENLPDVAIFMHAHRFAWHNNEIMDTDAAQMVRHLSPERVTREGYMNLRCHWDPGCPDHIHPGETQRNADKQEEVILAECWEELFPFEPIPTVLAQPCCAQFAVSRETILRIPKMRYIFMRDWITRTELSDYLSGRIFEYTWQYIFSAAPIHCPSMSACYCDGYGLCFGSPSNFDKWFEIRFRLNEYKEDLRVWEEKADKIEAWRKDTKDGKFLEEAELFVPEYGKDVKLRNKIRELKEDLNQRRKEAFERGKDPKQRAKESGRDWKEGDGF
ncbi:hypothetical protein PRZ48_002185 [Zasmidium cellare]|uniref:Uncharacterized protein n=1 Tax=Zasmidium cellare TaxID=395010 RepID=A0ABR0F424_ZASCE|nr:hypothetical protein PRZ48_002185 [Zasmidium cellare]